MSSWFGSRNHQEEPSNKLKHKQIESLRETIPGVVEVKRDEQYSLTTTVNGLTIILNIFLPPRFPQISPEITVAPSIKHPWVTDQMMVDGSPLLKNFTVHSKLGRAVEQVIREFQEHPPQLISSPLPYPMSSSINGSSNSIMVPSPSLSSSSSSFSPSSQSFVPYTFSSAPQSSSRLGAPRSPENRPRQPAPAIPARGNTVDGPVDQYRCPPIPESFDQIREMSAEDLKRYLNDTEGPVLVEEFVAKLDVIKKVQKDRENFFVDNEDLAAINLGHEPEIQDGWTHLQERFLKMEALRGEHEKKLKEQKNLIERYQQRNIVAQLKTSVNEADVDSEVYAESFLEGKVPVAEFAQKYKQMRKLHHSRKTKYEKLLNH